MPVILTEGVEDRWLDPGEGSRARLQALLTPYPAGEMAAFDVIPIVNSAGHDAPECIAPVLSYKNMTLMS